MTEQQNDPVRPTSAWLIQLPESPKSEFSLRVVTPAGSKTAVKENDWVLALSQGKIQRIGRLARVRHDREGTTIYFDRTAKAPVEFEPGKLGLTPTSARIVRLSWNDFERSLPEFGATKPEDIPLINDAVYVRDLLEAAVRDDLLGPAGGPEELIVDMSVRDRYLVGKLAPLSERISDQPRTEPASSAGEEGDLEELDKAPTHTPGAEFPQVSGRVDPENDALDEIDTSNNQSLVPSSLGMTFCVAPDVDTITIDAHWGRASRDAAHTGALLDP
jgi:hypothetical protein